MTTKQEKFIEKATKIHNNKYDYSKTNYIDIKKKIDIICPIHNLTFTVTPDKHIHRKQGCPKCSSNTGKKSTREEFIENAVNVHGNKFNYDYVVYENSSTKVKLFCNLHEKYFYIIPRVHLAGAIGCKYCSRIPYLITEEEFINRASEKYKVNNSYDKYNGYQIESNFLCNNHGWYKTTPYFYLHREFKDCQKCKNDNLYTLEKFINDANEIHNNKYDYSLTIEYTKMKDLAKIICPSHPSKIFEQTFDSHLRGSGCPNCSATIRTYKEFIEESKNKFINLYDYIIPKNKIENDIVRMKEKVGFICLKHKSQFSQDAYTHLKGFIGCNKCKGYIKSKKETEWLDSLNIPNSCRNIEITINDYKSYNVDAFDQVTNTVYEFHGDFWHGNLNIYKYNQLNKKVGETFGLLYEATMEKEELIKSAGYNLISIWEEDFDKLKIN